MVRIRPFQGEGIGRLGTGELDTPSETNACEVGWLTSREGMKKDMERVQVNLAQPSVRQALGIASDFVRVACLIAVIGLVRQRQVALEPRRLFAQVIGLLAPLLRPDRPDLFGFDAGGVVDYRDAEGVSGQRGDCHATSPTQKRPPAERRQGHHSIFRVLLFARWVGFPRMLILSRKTRLFHGAPPSQVCG